MPPGGTTASAVEGFLQGLKAGHQIARDRDASERADLSLGLQAESSQRANQAADLSRRTGEANLAAALEQQQREGAGRKVASAYLAAPGQTVEALPAQPAAIAPMRAVDADPEAFAQRNLPVTPARPAATVTAPTMETLTGAAKGAGVDLGAVLHTNAMKDAMALRKPVSAEQFEQQQRDAAGREEFHRYNDQATQALESGEDDALIRATGFRLRAMRAAVEAIKDPAQLARAAAALKADEKLYFDARKAPEEAAKASRELKPFTDALRAYRENPDHDTETAVLEAAANVSHKLALPTVKQVLDSFEKTAARNAKSGYVHKDIAALNTATVAKLQEMWGAGAPFTRETWIQARQAAAQEHPNGVAMLFENDARDPKAKGLSELDRAAFLDEVPVQKGNANEQAERQAIAIVRRKIKPGTPGFAEAVAAETTRIITARKPQRPATGPTGDDRAEQRLLTEMGQVENRIRGLNARIARDRTDRDATVDLGTAKTELAGLKKKIADLRASKGAAAADDDETDTETPGTPPPGGAAAKLTPEQRTTVRQAMTDVMGRLFPGRDPRSLNDAEKKRVETEVNRRLSGQ